MITAISENCDRPAYLLHSECFMGLGPCECEQACEDARPRRGMGFKKKTQISILQTNFSRMLAARRVRFIAHCDWSLDIWRALRKAAKQSIGAQ
jgi:alkylhydroperoxidase family enzyme